MLLQHLVPSGGADGQDEPPAGLQLVQELGEKPGTGSPLMSKGAVSCDVGVCRCRDTHGLGDDGCCGSNVDGVVRCFLAVAHPSIPH